MRRCNNALWRAVAEANKLWGATYNACFGRVYMNNNKYVGCKVEGHGNVIFGRHLLIECKYFFKVGAV